MSNRNKIIIFSAVAVILVLLIIFISWLFLRSQPTPPTPPVDPSEINIPVVLPQSSSVKKDEPAVSPSVENLAANLKSTAASFAERFGSYSNQGNFNNINDLRGVMTLKMNAWADNYIANQQSVVDESYFGVTTIAVSTKIITLSEELGQADIVVSTQRQENKGSTVNPRVTYQDIEIELVNTGSGWKVDSAEWQ